MKTNANDSAFPLEGVYKERGLTKREYFALHIYTHYQFSYSDAVDRADELIKVLNEKSNTND